MKLAKQFKLIGSSKNKKIKGKQNKEEKLELCARGLTGNCGLNNLKF